MLKVNRKVEYALIALKHMSRKAPGQLTSAKEISEEYQIPFDPTSRGLQLMNQQGILRAEQGARGGYQILRDLSKVSLAELNEMIDGPIKIASCLSNEEHSCDLAGSCTMIGPLLYLNERLDQLFHEIKVSDLIEIKHQGERQVRRRMAGQKVS